MIVIKYRFDSVLEYIFIETIILYAFRLYPSYIAKEMIMMMMVTELESIRFRAQIPNHMRFISTSNNFTLRMIVTVIVIDCFELWPLLLICKLSHNNTQISRWAHMIVMDILLIRMILFLLMPAQNSNIDMYLLEGQQCSESAQNPMNTWYYSYDAPWTYTFWQAKS